MKSTMKKPNNAHFSPVQTAPVMRGLISDTNAFWFAGGYENANSPAGFQEAANCDCHGLTDYAMPNDFAACQLG